MIWDRQLQCAVEEAEHVVAQKEIGADADDRIFKISN